MKTRSSLVVALLGITLLGWGAFAYGDSLSLPYFFDDAVHFRWLEAYSLADFWIGKAPTGYYRPMPFTLWKLCKSVTGTLPPVLLHSINLALHLINGGLVTALAYYLLRPPLREVAALVAGLFFLTFPFSYQVVPWVGALTHPLVTFFILGAMLTAEVAPRTWYWKSLSIVLAILALFTHEVGLLLGGWLLVCRLVRRRQGRPHRSLGYPLVLLGLGIAYVPLYFAMSDKGNLASLLDIVRLIQNGGYLLQSLAFPVAPLGRVLMRVCGLNDIRTAYLSAGLTVFLLTSLTWRARRLPECIGACALSVLSLLPAWLMLSFNYVISGPRLLYLSSASVALAWASGLQATVMAFHHRWRIAGYGLAGLLAVAILAFSLSFVRTRQQLHHWGGQMIVKLTTYASRTAPGDRLLCVNFPAWVAPRRIVYPVGHEGVLFLPNYMDIGDLIWVNGGPDVDFQALKFSNTLSEYSSYIQGVRGESVDWENLSRYILAADHVYTIRYEPHGIAVIEAGTVRPHLALLGEPIALFDDRVQLFPAALLTESVLQPAVQLIWKAIGPLDDADYRIFVHLYAEDGTLVAQDDGYALQGLLPLWLWEEGSIILDNRYLSAPSTLPQGRYTVGVGIYEGASGKRLSAFTGNGLRFADDVVPILQFQYPLMKTALSSGTFAPTEGFLYWSTGYAERSTTD